MALDLPDNPNVGDQHTEEGATWEWNGLAWVLLSNTGFPYVLKGGDTMTGRLFLNTVKYALEGQTFEVDPAGSANPADPYAGDPFDTLSSLQAFLGGTIQNAVVNVTAGTYTEPDRLAIGSTTININGGDTRFDSTLTGNFDNFVLDGCSIIHNNGGTPAQLLFSGAANNRVVTLQGMGRIAGDNNDVIILSTNTAIPLIVANASQNIVASNALNCVSATATVACIVTGSNLLINAAVAIFDTVDTTAGCLRSIFGSTVAIEDPATGNTGTIRGQIAGAATPTNSVLISSVGSTIAAYGYSGSFDFAGTWLEVDDVRPATVNVVGAGGSTVWDRP